MPLEEVAPKVPLARPMLSDSVEARRLRRCMMLEYDPAKKRWRDMLRRTPSAGVHGVHALHAPQRSPDTQTQGAGSAYPVNPMVLGLCLAFCPPLGVSLAWMSPALPREGKIALTLFGAFVFASFMATAVLVALR
jgi:hypothetical protein